VLGQLEPHRISLATPQAVRDAVRGHFAKSFASAAVDGLHARHPKRSAKEKLALWQRLSICFIPLAFAAAIAFEAWGSLRAISLALTVIFLPAIALRVFAAYALCRGEGGGNRSEPARLPDADLPVYTLLVPLYREANMLRPLTRALSRLDYPIKLILEAVDEETIAAAGALDLPGNVEILVVPDLIRAPAESTELRAAARPGRLPVIYDAEDRPERDQLRKAIAAFRQGPPNLACLQAKLNLYNADDNWLTRQFTIEYGALFDGLLPALERLRLPIPLGGTSNHFPSRR
jgi:cellulose synthase/poly-beta-1,6-N-acetylglucosamine synthase-like glycosyltransferase